MSETFDFVIGQKSMYELEATVDYNNLAFTFLKRSLPVYIVDNFTLKPGKTKDIALELKEVPFKMLCEDYILMDDILFKIRYVKEQKGKPTLVLCVPEKYIPIILYQYRTPLLAGHPGVMTMYHMVRKKYYFPTMLPLIKQFVASCYECQSIKESQPIPKVHYPRIPLDTRLMARVSMDIKEMPKSILGYNCILVCM